MPSTFVGPKGSALVRGPYPITPVLGITTTRFVNEAIEDASVSIMTDEKVVN
jgi:hypothetical protein